MTAGGAPRRADLAAGPPPDPSWPQGPVLVVGYARTGRAVAGALAGRGITVTALDDARGSGPTPAAPEGVQLRGPTGPVGLASLLRRCTLVVVSPGVPPGHPVHAAAAAAGVEVVSEIELAWRLSSVPVVAVTGTNGKTTVTTLVTSIAAAAGRSVLAAGNIGLPLVEAVLEPGLDLVVAEVSSFQLAFTSRFHAPVATVLNVNADHLDWHPDLAAYRAAKARLLATQGSGDVAVVNGEDPVALSIGRTGRAGLVTFGVQQGEYRVEGGELIGPGGVLAPLSVLARQMPHDLANAVAACATAEAAGIERSAAAAGLASVTALPHRVQLVASVGGIEYYDDSKATVPSAVVAALAGVPDCVLIAGGRNKGLDLSEMSDAARRRRGSVRAVVAIGEAAAELERAFAGWAVERAASMDGAVATATLLAREHGAAAVLLSPGCASFDWYGSYGERGEDFARAVRALAAPGNATAGAARR